MPRPHRSHRRHQRSSRWSPSPTTTAMVGLSLSSLMPWGAAQAQSLTVPPQPAAPSASAPEAPDAQPPGALPTPPTATSATPATPTMAPVTVRARRTPEAAGQRVVPAKELRQVPGTLGDPMKALQSLPGVSVADDSSSDPAIRGSRPEDNLYYIDGLPAGNLFHVGGLTSVLHPDLVQQFDLYSAGAGPQYADATGAVIDVKLRPPRTDRLGGSLNVGLLGADLLVEGPLTENQSFYFAGKRSYLDLVVDQATDGKGDGEDGVVVEMPRYHDYQGKYLWQINDTHQLSFNLNASSDALSFDVPQDSKLGQQQPVLTGTGDNRSKYHTEALTLESELGGGLSNRLSVGQQTSHLNQQVGTALRMTVLQRDPFVLEQFKFKPGDAHAVTLGAEAHSTRVTYDLNLRNARCTEFAADCDYTSAQALQSSNDLRVPYYNLYAQDRWQFTPTWTATAGVHYSDDQYLDRRNTEPRLGLEWQWSDATQFTAGWGRYNQSPSGDQIVKDIGNPELDHLHATHSVLGVSQKLTEGWSWRTEVYRKTFDDLVVADPTRNYVNGGSGQAHGLEVLVKKAQAGRNPLSGWLSVSWAHAQRRNDLTGESFRFEYDQPLIVNLVGSYQLSHGWQVGAKWTYHTGQPYTNIVGTGTYPDGRIRPLYGELNGSRLPAYHRLDLRAERQVSDRFSVYFELLNAYNRKNVSGYSYAADYQSRQPVEQLGLMPSLGIKADF